MPFSAQLCEPPDCYYPKLPGRCCCRYQKSAVAFVYHVPQVWAAGSAFCCKRDGGEAEAQSSQRKRVRKRANHANSGTKNEHVGAYLAQTRVIFRVTSWREGSLWRLAAVEMGCVAEQANPRGFFDDIFFYLRQRERERAAFDRCLVPLALFLSPHPRFPGFLAARFAPFFFLSASPATDCWDRMRCSEPLRLGGRDP